MPEASVAGRRGKLVKPSRDGGATGELDRFSAPFFHRESLILLKILGSKKPKLLRFMREAVRRRLSVEASELLTPLPLSFPFRVSSSVPQRFVTVNWGPTASCQHRSRGLRHRQGRNLNCSATRKRSRPVDGRR